MSRMKEGKKDKIKVLHFIGTNQKGTGGNTIANQIYEFFKKDDTIDTAKLILIKKCKERNDHEEFLTTSSLSCLNPISFFKFVRYLKENKIDIIHSHDFRTRYYSVFAKLFLREIKLIIHDHGIFERIDSFIFYKWLAKDVDKFIAVSDYTKKGILSINNRLKRKIEVVYNGVDRNKFRINSVSLRKKKNEIVIGIVGRLYKVKGQEYAIKAIAGFKDVRLVIIGGGPNEAYLKNLCKELNVEGSVDFLGERKKVSQLISRFDICLNTSIVENNSIAILEYMASGKPIIASNKGGNPELIRDGENGLLTDLNVNDIKEKINLLIKNIPLREKISKVALEDSKKYSLYEYLTNIKKIYLRLL